MEFNGILASLPLIAAIVGVISGTVTVLVNLLRGYRHVRQRTKQTGQPRSVEAQARFTSNSSSMARAMPSPGIRTPDQRLRVFVSSTLQELSQERAAARQAITRLRLTPVQFETGARPHPPRDLYRSYLAQSDVFVGIYWQKYGWVAPGEDVSGLEDEYRLAVDKPKLIYLKTPAPEREPRLAALLDRIRADDHASYKGFRTAAELRGLIADDLALLLTERFAHREAAEPKPAVAVRTSDGSDTRTNLPIQTTSFIGRQGELAEIKRLIDSSKLLTLTGPGGVGKTRLALQAAADVLERFTDGVWLVELAPVGQPELVQHVVARAVGVNEEPGQQVIDTLVSALRARQLLLVLDNCEHLLEACAQLADILLHSCGRLHVLATSRESLGVSGETIYHVPPLRVGEPSQMAARDAPAQSEAVELFVERACAALPTFSMTKHNPLSIAQLCDRLDGIPLAIELAAARVKVLTPEQILARLDDRFRLLSVGSRTAVPRQQTLRALVDWSYDLLSDQEKASFRRLSVFTGGWTLEAAEAVCGIDPIAPRDVLNRLGALVDKSLVLAEEQSDGQMRYRLLETLREYAAERLGEAREVEMILNKYAQYYLNEAERIDELRKTNWHRWRYEGWPWLHAEQDNLRAILGHCRDGRVDSGRELELGLRLCASLWWFQGTHNRYEEVWDWFLSLLAGASAPINQARFFALWYAGITGGLLARFERSEPLLAEARTLAQALGDEQAIALADGASGEDFLWQGRLSEAEDFNERGLARARRVGPRYYLPIFLYNAGWTALLQRRLDRAAELLNEAIAMADQLEDGLVLAMALPLRGAVSLGQQDLVGARAYLQRAMHVTEDLPNQITLGRVCLAFGQLAILEEKIDEATQQFLHALGIASHTGGRSLLCESLDGLAFVATTQGNYRSAVCLLTAVDRVRASMNQGRAPDDQRHVDAALSRARAALSDAEFAAECDRGQRLTLDDAIAYGRGLGGSHTESVTE